MGGSSNGVAGPSLLLFGKLHCLSVSDAIKGGCIEIAFDTAAFAFLLVSPFALRG